MLVLGYKLIVYAHHVSEDVFLFRHGVEAEIESMYLGDAVVVLVAAEIVDIRRNFRSHFCRKRRRKPGVVLLQYEFADFVVVLEFVYVGRYERGQVDYRLFSAAFMVLLGASEQIRFERERERTDYKIVPCAVHLV